LLASAAAGITQSASATSGRMKRMLRMKTVSPFSLLTCSYGWMNRRLT
jgi:hypothetical protein